MKQSVNLKVDFCSYKAAKWAVEHWHYSKTMPKSKLVKFGVWENDIFIGAVIYGVGATSDLVKSYGLKHTEGCELVRVALANHYSQVTKILSLTRKMLLIHSPGLRVIVSFADPEQNHDGTIYQADNWYYTGDTQPSEEYIVNGKRWHGRALRHEKPANLTTKEALKKLDSNYRVVMGSSKYRYLYPLDRAMRRQIEPLAKPYPKREDMRTIEGNTLTTS